MARRYYPEPRAYYHRKMQKTNAPVAHSALAHKLARAGYYVMRDQVPFDPQKLFGTRGRGWNGEPEFGVGQEPPDLIGQPFHPNLIRSSTS